MAVKLTGLITLFGARAANFLELGDLNFFLKTNSNIFRKFSNWYHLARGLPRLNFFRKFSIWYHPGAQKHTFPASEHGLILVWAVPDLKIFRKKTNWCGVS